MILNFVCTDCGVEHGSLILKDYSESAEIKVIDIWGDGITQEHLHHAPDKYAIGVCKDCADAINEKNKDEKHQEKLDRLDQKAQEFEEMIGQGSVKRASEAMDVLENNTLAANNAIEKFVGQTTNLQKLFKKSMSKGMLSLLEEKIANELREELRGKIKNEVIIEIEMDILERMRETMNEMIEDSFGQFNNVINKTFQTIPKNFGKRIIDI